MVRACKLTDRQYVNRRKDKVYLHMLLGVLNNELLTEYSEVKVYIPT